VVITLGDPLVDFALRALITLLVVIDPAGLVPAYISLVGGRAPATRPNVAGRAVAIAGLVLLAFSVVGGPLLAYLGITLGALQVAGGILLFRIAMDMVFAQLRRETPEEAAEARSREDISVFPLAIPLIAGPGALASVLILTSEAAGDPSRYVVVMLATVVVLVVAYVFLRTARRFAALLGQTGINVVTRVLGLVLAALAVQYVADGLVGLGLVSI
jgi:multiple antibiotic resistance protein